MKNFLMIMLLFVGVTAVVSGLIIIYRPDGSIMHLQLSVLRSTPFKNFLIPGIVLTSVVGLTNLLAVYFNLKNRPAKYNWAMVSGIMICGWIVVQIILISYFYWLQVIYLGAGISIILTAYQLKGKWAV